MAKRRPSTCRNTINGKCKKGKYKLHYEDNVPMFICNFCQDRDITWQKFYNEYLQLFKHRDNWDEKRHLVSCVMGFFCHMYKDFYKTEFIFVPQNPNVYSCKEMRDAQKLIVTFKGNGHDVRRYIYWFFTKFIKSNTNIVSFAYINSPAIVRKYNLQRAKKHAITRSTKLSREFIDWCEINATTIFDDYELTTINDLGALLSHVKFYKSDKHSVESLVIQKAEQLNFIRAGKLNIGE